RQPGEPRRASRRRGQGHRQLGDAGGSASPGRRGVGVDTDAAAGVGAQVASRPKSSDVMALFAVMWAAATLFHVWGSSGDITDLASNWSTLGALQAAAAVAALGVLARPRALAPSAVMASLAPFTACFGAPVL